MVNVLFQMNNLQISDTSQKTALFFGIGSNSQIFLPYGRVGMNCMNLLYAFENFNSGGLVKELKKLERRFQEEMNTLIEIELSD